MAECFVVTLCWFAIGLSWGAVGECKSYIAKKKERERRGEREEERRREGKME